MVFALLPHFPKMLLLRSSSRARTVVNASGGAEGDFMDAGELEREAAALEEAGDVRDAVDWEIQA